MTDNNISTEDVNPILHGKLRPTMMRMALPIMFAMLFQVAFNLVDTYFVSLLGSQALAAMGLTFPMFMIIISISTGLSIGVSSLVARCIGEDNLSEAGNAAVHGLLLAVALGFILSVTGVLLHKPILIFTGATGAILQASASYIKIIYLSTIFNFTLFCQEGIFRGSGQMKFSMLVMLAATVVNVILDPILIFGIGFFPRLELAGAAWATGISWFCGSSFALVIFSARKTKIKLYFKNLSFRFSIWSDILRVGLPSALSQGTMAISMSFINNLALGFGPAVVAAYAVGFRLDQIALVPGMAISAAVIAAVGQNYGARQWLRVREAFQHGALMAFIIMASLGVIIFSFPSFFMGLFVQETVGSNLEMWSSGTLYLRYSSVGYLFLGAGMVANSSFQACGFGWPALVNTLFRLIVLTVPLAYFFAYSLNMGAEGLWLGMLLANVSFGLLGLSWFYHGFSRKLLAVSSA